MSSSNEAEGTEHAGELPDVATSFNEQGSSMSVVSCSHGINGLTTKHGWQVQGDVPHFPYIGGSDTIAGWNSASCGDCFAITYNSRTIHMLAIDHTLTGLNGKF
ncbi:hypothetical protein LTR42_000298 [Elasticomyces elasticus]|nr:hypothetical protein LTR42_000298 [Elasticomyces elasticus]